jgi:hypothetical protein
VITALLSWYDEPVELLEDGVRSLAGFCDRIIAVDGAYKFTPRAHNASPAEQASAIRGAADDVGLEVEVHSGRIWEGQIEKRQHLFDLATDSDWLLIHDADHELEGDPAMFRWFLDNLADDVVTVEVSYETPAVPGKEITPWHEWLTTGSFYTPLIFRNLPLLRVERHHWWYSGLLDGELVALWGWDKSGGDFEGANDLQQGRHKRTGTLQVTHRCFDRPDEILERQRGLYAARADLVAASGVEL